MNYILRIALVLGLMTATHAASPTKSAFGKPYFIFGADAGMAVLDGAFSVFNVDTGGTKLTVTNQSIAHRKFSPAVQMGAGIPFWDLVLTEITFGGRWSALNPNTGFEGTQGDAVDYKVEPGLFLHISKHYKLFQSGTLGVIVGGQQVRTKLSYKDVDQNIYLSINQRKNLIAPMLGLETRLHIRGRWHLSMHYTNTFILQRTFSDAKGTTQKTNMRFRSNVHQVGLGLRYML